MGSLLQDVIRQNISRLRVGLGLTQQELAKRAGVSTSYIGSLERGLKVPSLKTIEKLADAMSVSPATLLLRHTQQSRAREELDILITQFDQNEVEYLYSVAQAYNTHIRHHRS
ncbi:MAG: helix-turn-helix transcriptional regulator [Peptococcaceae bacterium]|nr:helix-turn-helix transcriptional regulator [Peptococcaceae bacterium]